jgi:peptidoglycan-associated lipoprotein
MMRRFSVKMITLMFCLVIFALMGCTQKAAVKDETVAETKPEAKAETKMEEVKKQAEAGYQFASIYFDFDKAVISDESKATLDKHAQWMKLNTIATVVVEGHCDERGTAEYNLALGQRRADAAVKYLGNLGVTKDRLKTVSYGKEKPVDPGHNEAAWAKNRRDEFIIKK